MKLCSICNEFKPFDAAQARKSKASGFFGSKCWACYLVHKAPGNCIASKRWYEKNATPEFLAAEVTRHRLWQQANPGKANANTYKYRTAKTRQMPNWADLEKIQAVYIEAATKGLTVDHVIPLQGRLVSGLHVHNNLQLLTHAENVRKSNRFEIA